MYKIRFHQMNIILQSFLMQSKNFGRHMYLFIILVDTPRDVCNPSPCGPNSQCRVNNNQAVCSCLPIFIGSPPACRPECVTSSDCSLVLACMNQKCQDPCPNSCGQHSNCRVIKHNPICSCKNGYTGDPFTVCFQTPGINFNFYLMFFYQYNPILFFLNNHARILI